VQRPKKTGNKRMSAPKNGNGNGNAAGLMIPIGAVAFLFVALLETISYLAWTTTNSNLDRIEKQIERRTRELDGVRIREHERIEQQLTGRLLLIEKDFLRLQEHKEFTVRLDSQLGKMEERLKDAATRNELDTRLGINSGSIIQVRADIDTLKRDLGQTYPLKEVLGNLNARLDRMEQWSRSPPPHQSAK